MTLQDKLAACREEYKRQMATEAQQPAPYKHPAAWREGEPGHEESKADVFRQDKAGHVVAEFYGDWQEVKDNSEYYIEARNLNPKRLAVVQKLLEKVDACVEISKTLNDDREHAVTILGLGNLELAAELLGLTLAQS